MRSQFLEHIKSWYIDAIHGCQSHHWSIGGFVPVCLCAWGSDMLWSCNVLGSHAWPISRTCQIVAHWCNSWVTVASLVDRRISMITARSCTSRQMDPIERKPFLGIHFIVYVFGASMCDVFTFEHVIVLSGVSQMDRMKWKLTTFGGQKRVALSRPNQLKIWLKIQKSTLPNFFLSLFSCFRK